MRPMIPIYRKPAVLYCIRLVVLTIFLLGLAVPESHAQTADDLMDRFVEAWNAEDQEAMDAMLAEDAMYWDANSLLEGKEEVATSWGEDKEAVNEMRITTLRSEMSGNLAYHAGRWELLDSAGESTAHGGHTFVFTRNDKDNWQITSAHVEEASPDREQVSALLDAYFEGLEGGDASEVSFAEDVVMENPNTRRSGEPMRGIDEVVEFYESAGANMPRVEVHRHVIDGSDACTILEWDTAGGITVPTVNCFEIEDGKIKRVEINFNREVFEE